MDGPTVVMRTDPSLRLTHAWLTVTTTPPGDRPRMARFRSSLERQGSRITPLKCTLSDSQLSRKACEKSAQDGQDFFDIQDAEEAKDIFRPNYLPYSAI